jgi:GTP-binding protein YchF
MALSCGIVGLPNVGKSTLFNALTGSGAAVGAYAFVTTEPQVSVVGVPDARLGVINGMMTTEKVIEAELTIVDIPALTQGAYKGEGMGNKFLGRVKETDAILHVVQCFERGDLGRETPVDPQSDIEGLELELAMADLETVERNVVRVSKKARAGDDASIKEKAIFERAQAHLVDGGQLRHVEWSVQELEALRPLFLLTTKPVLYVANVSDEDVDGESGFAQAVAAHAAESGDAWIPVSCDIEGELKGMDAEDREMFMEELGIEELSLSRLIRATYELLGMQTFFTAGEKEIRAWNIVSGDTAPVAAGKIHSDFEKAFIKAEVYSVDDLVEHETEGAIKAAGKMRIEGKDYVMRESDVVHFLIGK